MYATVGGGKYTDGTACATDATVSDGVYTDETACAAAVGGGKYPDGTTCSTFVSDGRFDICGDVYTPRLLRGSKASGVN